MADNRGGYPDYSYSLPNDTACPTQNEQKDTQNAFVNDGSFLEMYKKRIEEMKKAKNSKATSESSSGDKVDESESCSTKNKLDDASSKAVKPSVVSQGKRKLMVGRMGGASKQFHAKKRKQEKQEALAKDSESLKSDNSAWNAYMEEVKKYREGSCTEEVDRIRPLVK